MNFINSFQRALSVLLEISICLTSLAPGFALPAGHFSPQSVAFYHNPNTGKFWTEDTYEGVGSDPSSLHKYTFCHNNPINGRDSSGHEFDLTSSSFTVALGSLARGMLLSFQQSFTTCGFQSAAAGALVGGGTGGLISADVTAMVDAFTGQQSTAEELLKAFDNGFDSGAVAGAMIAWNPYTAGAYFAYSSYVASMDFWKDLHDPSVPMWKKYLDAANVVASLAPLAPSVSRKLNEMLQVFCFPAGTEIATETGSKPIEEIYEGDIVWAQSDKTGEIMLKRVKQVFANVSVALVVLHCGTNTLEATPEHPLWVANQGWKAADQIQVGDELVTRSGERVSVTDISHQQGAFTVYNFEVDGAHSYFAGQDQVLVHNACDENILRLGWDPAVKKLRQAEGELAVVLEKRLGIQLQREQTGKVDWMHNGTSYDAVGAGLKSEFFDNQWGNVTEQITSHLIKADVVVVDARLLSSDQVQRLETFIKTLPDGRVMLVK